MIDYNDQQAVAEACAKQMWLSDTASQQLGMEIQEIKPGHAQISMNVTNQMINGLGSCHGGYLFTLADSTFAFACNTYDQRTVAQHCTISYLAPAQQGEQLLAIATEVSRLGRNGIYDVKIINAEKEPIVEFRGYSRTVRGKLLQNDGDTIQDNS